MIEFWAYSFNSKFSKVNKIRFELLISTISLEGLSTPNADTTASTFGHMLSMLFQWFNATAYLPNDKTGNALEKLKSEYLPNWLQKVNWNDKILCSSSVI